MIQCATKVKQNYPRKRKHYMTSAGETLTSVTVKSAQHAKTPGDVPPPSLDKLAADFVRSGSGCGQEKEQIVE